VALAAALPDHPLLDRIVRGRFWIPILGILLAGIVAMQVEVLKLSADTGRSIERGAALLSRNEQLRASVAALSDEGRIERLAAAMGMVMPDPTAVDFLRARPGITLRRAEHNIHQPDPSGFVASLLASGASAGGAGASTGSTSALTGTGIAASVGTPAVTGTSAGTTAVGTSTVTGTSAGTTAAGTSTVTGTSAGTAAAGTSTVTGTSAGTTAAGTSTVTGTSAGTTAAGTPTATTPTAAGTQPTSSNGAASVSTGG
jgi:hypothetical protein